MTQSDEAEHVGLEAAIVADPGDDAPRLIYADWLCDHGEEDRGNFIRDAVRHPASEFVNLTREGRDPLALLGLQPLPPPGGGRRWMWGESEDLGLVIHDLARHMSYRVDRGMIDAVRCGQPDPFASWEMHGPWLARHHPIRRALFLGVARGSFNHHIMFRGVGNGDVPARLWDATGLPAYACHQCPDGAPPGMRGTHACLGSLAHAEKVLSAQMIAWARQEIGGRHA